MSTASKIHLGWGGVEQRCMQMAQRIDRVDPIVFGVPRGGVYAALNLLRFKGTRMQIVSDPNLANTIVDDIVCSGKTKALYQEKYPDKPFFALVEREPGDDAWYVFPWEEAEEELQGPEENVRRLIRFIGDDPNREGLKDTPARVLKSYSHIFSGYGQRVEDVLTTFEDGACDEMVLVKDVEFYSTCEHHNLPFYGKAHIAYIPDGKVIGASKLPRILEIFSRRLQMQERITQQVTEALMAHLKPKGAACMLEAKHLCMMCRGIQKQQSVMVTSSLKGVFFDDPRTRSEFYSMVNRQGAVVC